MSGSKSFRSLCEKFILPFANNQGHPEQSRGTPLRNTSGDFIGMPRLPRDDFLTGLKDRNYIAHGNEFLHPCGIPVGGADARVTGRATDCFRLVRSVNADMRFA